MIRINELHLTLDEPISLLRHKVLKKLRIADEELLSMRIVKESIDARRKGNLMFSYAINCTVADEERVLKYPNPQIIKIEEKHYEVPEYGNVPLKQRPVIAGFGPAGMFAALVLAQNGYAPIVLERGNSVEHRVEKVEEFWNQGVLDETTNVQFGEGGAGTFSDGKLTTRIKDLRATKVLEELAASGADPAILYEAHPHIGTDQLRHIVKDIRERIIALGGEIRFLSALEEINIKDGTITNIRVNGETINCDNLILAIGHSARDTFRMLEGIGMQMEAKPFAVGARIEHPQKLINEAQYHEFANHPRLSAAEYRLTHQARNGRGVYTFCMCPGGFVVASTSAKGMVAVNGMSEHDRNQENANAAILVQVGPEDFGTGVLDGVNFQEELERKAYILGKETYRAPAQLVKDFLNHEPSKQIGSVKPSYAIGVELCDLHNLFPDYISEALEEGILAFDKKLKGFAIDDAIMTGVETRTSSPIRMNRDKETCMSLSFNGIYPCGEGAGYAGGIVSAAVDGIRCAEAIIKQYKPWHS